MTLTKYEFLTKARENFVNRKDEEEEKTPTWSVKELQHKCWGMRKGTITRFLLLLFSSLKITKCISTHFYTFLQYWLYSEHIAYWHSYQASSNIFHMHLAKRPSLQPGSSWRSANILTCYKEAHTRNSFSPAPEENWNENYVIMDWLKEACQP